MDLHGLLPQQLPVNKFKELDGFDRFNSACQIEIKFEKLKINQGKSLKVLSQPNVDSLAIGSACI